jgi:gas vesicle protein
MSLFRKDLGCFKKNTWKKGCPMSSNTNDDSILGFVFGLLVGLLGATVAGILYAPKRGTQTRDDVWLFTRTLTGKVSKDIKNPYGRTRGFFDKTRFRVENRIDRVTDSILAGKLKRAKRLEDSENGYDYH